MHPHTTQHVGGTRGLDSRPCPGYHKLPLGRDRQPWAQSAVSAECAPYRQESKHTCPLSEVRALDIMLLFLEEYKLGDPVDCRNILYSLQISEKIHQSTSVIIFGSGIHPQNLGCSLKWPPPPDVASLSSGFQLGSSSLQWGWNKVRVLDFNFHLNDFILFIFSYGNADGCRPRILRTGFLRQYPITSRTVKGLQLF